MIAVAACGIVPARAFDLSTYAEHSRLAAGRWVKVSVEGSGMYELTAATLRSMGFSNPANVRVYGYGGRRIDDVLSASAYIDDLPMAPQRVTDRGVVFYAAGPEQWVRSTSGTTPYFHADYNPYSAVAYYYVTEVSGDSIAPYPSEKTALPGHGNETAVTTTAQGRVHHEVDITMATEAGPLMVGEDFRYTPTRKFEIATPGRAVGTQVWMECQFVARHVGTTSTLNFTVNGQKLPTQSTDRLAATSTSHYVHATIGTSRRTFLPSGDDYDKLSIELNHSGQGVIEKANLDYITVNYTRKLEMPQSGYLEFWANSRALELAAATSDLELWDVTVPTATTCVDYELAGTTARWRPSTVTWRSYVAWRPGATLPSPRVVGTVTNQDLHGSDDTPEMVIIATKALMSQGRRIAALHESLDSMRVAVVDAQQIYNEFSSGAADVSGLRKYLKMVYDRGAVAGRRLKYALLLGRATLDNRCLAATTRVLDYQTLPAWVNREARHSMNDNDGFATDDFIAMLGDNSGGDLGLDDLSIAVGRIPMMSESDGIAIVDKFEQYMRSAKSGGWKNRILVLADDEDQGVHLRQAEAMTKGFLNTPRQQHIIDKVYLDAYIRSGGAYPDARREMFSALDEGVAWWIFTGHANNHSWTGDGQLTYTDINNMYLRNLPFLVASTCDFLRWDSETTSGGEIMYKERYGGVIGMISATRPVYISDNGYWLESLGRALLKRGDDGCLLTPGEIYRRSKNDILNTKGEHVSNSNRLRFVFMGDPAIDRKSVV